MQQRNDQEDRKENKKITVIKEGQGLWKEADNMRTAEVRQNEEWRESTGFGIRRSLMTTVKEAVVQRPDGQGLKVVWREANIFILIIS